MMPADHPKKRTPVPARRTWRVSLMAFPCACCRAAAAWDTARPARYTAGADYHDGGFVFPFTVCRCWVTFQPRPCRNAYTRRASSVIASMLATLVRMQKPRTRHVHFHLRESSRESARVVGRNDNQAAVMRRCW